MRLISYIFGCLVTMTMDNHLYTFGFIDDYCHILCIFFVICRIISELAQRISVLSVVKYICDKTSLPLPDKTYNLQILINVSISILPFIGKIDSENYSAFI